MWDVLGKTQSDRLQKLQNQAARVIMSMSNDTDQSTALQALGWEPLNTMRRKAKAKLMYKVLNKMALEPLTKRGSTEHGLLFPEVSVNKYFIVN